MNDFPLMYLIQYVISCYFFFFQAEDGIRDYKVTGVQTCALPISATPAGPAASEGEELAEFMIFRPAARTGFQVERLGPGSFAVRGRGIELLLGRYDVSNEEALAYVEERLRRIGVMRALQAEGFQAGDQLEIGGVSLKVDPK